MIRRAGWRVIATLPRLMDASNAEVIGQQLVAAIDSGATEVVADMTATRSCDYAGAGAVIKAYEHGVLSGTRLRLAVADPAVRRGLTIGGLIQIIPTYRSVSAATAGGAGSAWGRKFTSGPPDQAANVGPEVEADNKGS